MPFSSLLFLHLFLPAFLVVYWLMPKPAKNYTAIAASLVFYAWGAPRFLPVVVALGIVDYFISHQIATARARPEDARRARWMLAAGVTMHLSVLVYFKYSIFFVGQFSELLKHVGIAPPAWTWSCCTASRSPCRSRR